MATCRNLLKGAPRTTDPPGEVSLVISTTVSASQRAITIQHADGTSDRLALIRHRDGDVHWRADGFAVDEKQGTGLQWERHDGRVTVAQVLERAPHCERDVRRWTFEEIEDGPELIELDIFARAVRAEALRRLQAEADAAFSGS